MSSGKKLAVVFASIVVVLVGTAITIHFVEQHKAEAYQEDLAKFHQAVSESQQELDAQILAEKIKYVGVKFGEADASLYKLCHTNPPSQESNKKRCDRLDSKVERALAKEPPW